MSLPIYTPLKMLFSQQKRKSYVMCLLFLFKILVNLNRKKNDVSESGTDQFKTIKEVSGHKNYTWAVARCKSSKIFKICSKAFVETTFVFRRRQSVFTNSFGNVHVEVCYDNITLSKVEVKKQKILIWRMQITK